MNINNKGFKDWTEEDLQEIIGNEAYRESEYIDYKESFAVMECSDKQKRREKQNEFRHDICSFANADGGYLIFGIKEEGGIPAEIKGILISDTDKFELDRRNELSSICPVVPMVEFSFVELSRESFVVILKVFRGNHKPYLYKGNEDNYRFYVRRGNGNQTMSYIEIKENFLHSNSFSMEIRKFRKERFLFYKEEYPDIPFALIQVVPADFLNVADSQILYSEYMEKDINSKDFFNSLYHGCAYPNVDGVYFFDYEQSHKYAMVLQLFNNGISELLYEIDIKAIGERKWILASEIIEKMKELVKGTKNLFVFRGRHLTSYICVTISGCKGMWNDGDPRITYSAQIDRNEINCMPIEIHDIADDGIVKEAMDKCEMVINYSVGKRSNK